jgi:hypothetical protein
MTQDEIIEMAKQSELGFLLGDNWMLHHELEYFAKLVAQHERKACLPPTPISENALYTDPPQRTWVGLTEEDLREFAAAQYSWEDLLIAAEAKLKAKNT